MESHHTHCFFAVIPELHFAEGPLMLAVELVAWNGLQRKLLE